MAVGMSQITLAPEGAGPAPTPPVPGDGTGPSFDSAASSVWLILVGVLL